MIFVFVFPLLSHRGRLKQQCTSKSSNHNYSFTQLNGVFLISTPKGFYPDAFLVCCKN